ncbi:ABC transporter permease [Arthrobacter methylotrophus]|uniref:ABC transporter permease n=1 Tax=Arthrobacter methylotrophus TaxID=121291 RepID=A0ABV5UNI1_9MICC
MIRPTSEAKSKVTFADLIRIGGASLMAKPLRTVLSALGIAIGIASMLTIVGISSSSQAKLNEQLAKLGTNLLTIEPGKSVAADADGLPIGSAAKARRIDGVLDAKEVSLLTDQHVYRSRIIDPLQSEGIDVLTFSAGLGELLNATLKAGHWPSGPEAAYPTTVLGARAAERLGIVSPGSQIVLDGRDITVTGILEPLPLAPELDTAALIGQEYGKNVLGWDGRPTRIYERSTDFTVLEVKDRLPKTINPQSPLGVEVSRPSEALAAKTATDAAFNGLLFALGGISLLIGGIGVANTMIISVIERRQEVGLRRALGATRSHIRFQFLLEALQLSVLGGLAGILVGTASLFAISAANGWPPTIPPSTIASAIASTLVIGLIAGIYPATRASNIPPTTALAGAPQ